MTRMGKDAIAFPLERQVQGVKRCKAVSAVCLKSRWAWELVCDPGLEGLQVYLSFGKWVPGRQGEETAEQGRETWMPCI